LKTTLRGVNCLKSTLGKKEITISNWLKVRSPL
jgi:hypothetical protein